jgi:signal transduction histidine kinase
MKVLPGILFTLFASISVCYSQITSRDNFQLSALPSEGVLLDKGWKFHPGDSIEFGEPGFNDSGWENIDPTKDLHYLPQMKTTSVGWLRIQLHIDSSLLYKPLAFEVFQSVASEIYLNGKLIRRFGTVSPDTKKVIAFQPLDLPVGIHFDQADQVLAVRFSVKSNLPYLKYVTPYYAFRLHIIDVEHTGEFTPAGNRFQILNSVYVGIFLVLTIIHFGLFIIFRQQKANLYFSIATLSGAIANGLFIAIINSHDVAFVAYGVIIDWLFLFTFFNLFLFIAIQHLFSREKSIYFRLIVAYSLLSLIFWFTGYERSELWAFFLPFFISMIESLRISTLAYRKGHRYAGLIVTGISCYLIFMSVFGLIYEGLVPNITIGFANSFTLIDALYQLAVISVPLALSLYLSRDFAFTSKELEIKLQEVEQLSSEKQRILAQQNETLEKKVTERTAQLNESLMNLRTTQNQLIHSEKMASLGELTAGIAHEIQNPLNFVNNFSEVNVELSEELKDELQKANLPSEVKLNLEPLIETILGNQEKIVHHGKRADSIVKSMLAHSRTSTGHTTATEINALVDEYLRLSYNGMRAKERSFQCSMQTDFDPGAGNINIVAQDIGRVLLNLFSNAFYAVFERKKLNEAGYDPLASVSTKRTTAQLIIKIRDNGSGIPEKVKDKIFQPFFTTKPTGQGTGLGLSLSYDIIKAHGGDINVETKEGEFTEFVVELPV